MSHVVIICISLIRSEVEHFSHVVFAFSSLNCHILSNFFIGLLICRSPLLSAYILKNTFYEVLVNFILYNVQILFENILLMLK